jgi:hypothetical protein
MSNPPIDLHKMRLTAQRAMLDAHETLVAVAVKPARRDKDRLYKQVTRRVQR